MGDHEINLDEDTEEALLTLCASQGIDMEEAVNSAVVAYATILQGPPGAIAEIYRASGGERESVKRVQILHELHESEIAIKAAAVLAGCGIALIAFGILLVAAISEHDGWLSIVAAGGMAVVVGILLNNLDPFFRPRRGRKK